MSAPDRVASYDNGYVWPIRASEVFVEDTVLCGASLVDRTMCIRRVGDDLLCSRHGQRKATGRTPPSPAGPDGQGVRTALPDPPPVVPGAWRIVGPTVLPIRAHQLLTGVHDADECADRPCPVHDPSEHHMLPFDLHWRADRGMFERICGHGVGHPDPDQVAHWRWMLSPEDADAEAIHGCDGCCRPGAGA